MTQQSFLDAPQLRDRGMALALTHAGPSWKARALEVLKTFKGELQIEDLRAECEKRGIVPPTPNAWGGLAAAAVKEGLIVATGEWRVTRSAKTHGHRTLVYRAIS